MKYVVFNHKMGADFTERVKSVRVARDNRNHEYGGDIWIDAWTGFDFSERQNKYSTFKWRWFHFDGTDWAANLKEAGKIYKYLDERTARIGGHVGRKSRHPALSGPGITCGGLVQTTGLCVYPFKTRRLSQPTQRQAAGLVRHLVHFETVSFSLFKGSEE
jgi:hypothetical protein